MALKGTSTLVTWRCESDSPDGFVKLPITGGTMKELHAYIRRGKVKKAKRLLIEFLRSRPRGLLWIPVRSFQCDNRGMTRDMHETLKGDTYRIIAFQYNRLSNFTLLRSPPEGGLRMKLTLVGGLMLAGSAKTIRFDVTVIREGTDRFRIKGQADLKMSEFGITPPTALMDLIQVHDPVSIDLNLQARAISDRKSVRPFVRRSLSTYESFLRKTTPESN